MFIFHIIIVTLGLATSYTDIKYKKIKNTHLVLAIIFSLSAFPQLIQSYQIHFTLNFVLNILIAFVIGLSLYLTDSWAAGDAKLFFVYSLLMPTEKYPQSLFFPSVALFTNIFLVSFTAIVILSIEEVVRDWVKITKKLFSPARLSVLGKSFFIFFSLQWVIEYYLDIIRPHTTRFIVVLSLFISFGIIRWMINRIKNAQLVFCILIMGLISRFIIYPFDNNISNLLLQLQRTSLFTISFHIIYVVFDLNQTDDKNSKIIPFAPFMLLGTLIADTNLLQTLMLFFSVAPK